MLHCFNKEGSYIIPFGNTELIIKSAPCLLHHVTNNENSHTEGYYIIQIHLLATAETILVVNVQINKV